MIKKYAVLIALLSLLSFIMFAGWGNYYLLKKDAATLSTAVKKIQASVENGNWENARGHLNETLKVWEKSSKYWPMLIHHQEMDRIEESMNRIKSYLEYQDSSMSMAELYNLIFYIRHIPEKESLNLQNVF